MDLIQTITEGGGLIRFKPSNEYYWPCHPSLNEIMTKSQMKGGVKTTTVLAAHPAKNPAHNIMIISLSLVVIFLKN
jgi:hypothetical protein